MPQADWQRDSAMSPGDAESQQDEESRAVICSFVAAEASSLKVTSGRKEKKSNKFIFR